MKLNVVGNIFGTSGYASHTRSLVNGLFNIGVEVSLQCQLPPGWESQVNDNELKMIKTAPFFKENTLAVTMPNQWVGNLSEPHKLFFGYVVWEGTKIPKFWVKYLQDSRLDYILVPSEHTKRAVLEAEPSLEAKILVVPHGVDAKTFRKLDSKRIDGVYKFVANKGWASGMNDRGGLQWLLKAFNEEFKNEPVELVVKLNTAYCGPGWNLDAEMSKLELVDSGCKINFVFDNLSFEALNKLYNDCDCFVSPNMGEAFGLPMCEARSAGLPVIATGFGGQLDFLSDKTWLIDYSLVENTWDVMYEGVSWAKPNMNDLRRLLRKAFVERPKGKSFKWSSWEESAQIIVDKC